MRISSGDVRPLEMKRDDACRRVPCTSLEPGQCGAPGSHIGESDPRVRSIMDSGKGGSGVTIGAPYFRELYERNPDPYRFTGSAYERAKYAATLAALPRARYGNALELGCSIGIFTALLARRCGALLAVDCAPAAVAATRARCHAFPRVEVRECDVLCDFPEGRYELVTFCELGYYFGPADSNRIRAAIANALVPAGDLVVVHWRPSVEGHAQSADDVHAAFLGDSRFAVVTSGCTEWYRLDVLRKRQEADPCWDAP